MSNEQQTSEACGAVAEAEIQKVPMNDIGVVHVRYGNCNFFQKAPGMQMLNLGATGIGKRLGEHFNNWASLDKFRYDFQTSEIRKINRWHMHAMLS
ncbi:hypothetical protein BdWA1_000943 [Babesia duncani]|uniref:Uncharacterized protein n=1 Tax=Babesia duncani TaxID=323732 RepID=A0AAD9PNH9_9APIC|nr:hypothetical protein BdWA1_000943 [Babesia duncani]